PPPSHAPAPGPRSMDGDTEFKRPSWSEDGTAPVGDDARPPPPAKGPRFTWSVPPPSPIPPPPRGGENSGGNVIGGGPPPSPSPPVASRVVWSWWSEAKTRSPAPPPSW
ncbi:unnamed protein product, partial [Ectocarpus sp. 8 AP-2014]